MKIRLSSSNSFILRKSSWCSVNNFVFKRPRVLEKRHLFDVVYPSICRLRQWSSEQELLNHRACFRILTPLGNFGQDSNCSVLHFFFLCKMGMKTVGASTGPYGSFVRREKLYSGKIKCPTCTTVHGVPIKVPSSYGF